MGQVWYLIVSIPDLCTLTYFHDVIYHIPHCNADNRRRNDVFTIIGRLKYGKNTRNSQKKELREILTVCSRWRNRYRL